MSVDRVFLDANILFSAAYGSPGLERLWELADKGLCWLLASGYVIEESKRNLHNTHHLKRINTYLEKVRIVLEADPSLQCPIDLPEKDKPVLMAAIAAKADYLLTGDKTHFGQYFGQTVMGLKILMVRDYLRLRNEGGS